MTNNTGILLTNIGTPDAPTPSAVRRYLREFLSDRRVVEIPRIIWLPILYSLILTTRPRKSAALYQKIWTKEGSPLLLHSRAIAADLQAKLNLPVALGMHYGDPSILAALCELRAQEVDRIIVLPLFPQYSATTTAVTFDLVTSILKSWRDLPEIHFLKDYAEDPNYLTALQNSMLSTWQTIGRAEHLLFSFHGIPQHCADAGDIYPEQCRLTARALANSLALKPGEWSISFQSRLGKAAWLQPYTDQMLMNLAQQGVKDVQVICPGFAVDCLETLEEIAIRGKEIFLAHGGEKFHYIPALNNQGGHIAALRGLVKRYL